MCKRKPLIHNKKLTNLIYKEISQINKKTTVHEKCTKDINMIHKRKKCRFNQTSEKTTSLVEKEVSINQQ